MRLIAQDFAPIGAEWYYTEGFSFSGDKNFLKITSVMDTMYQGKACHQLVKTRNLDCSTRPDIEYVFSEDSAVYFWDNDFNEFQKLYDFKAIEGNSWIIRIKDWDDEIDTILITVDSTDLITINEKQLKVLYVTYSAIYDIPGINFYYNSKIVEKIGDFSYLFNLYPESFLYCDMNYSEGLRCYEDSDLGFYSTGIADSCTYTYTWTSVDENSMEKIFEIFPNPTTGQFQINVNSEKNITIEICDLIGGIIFSKDFTSNTQIDLTGLPNGLYIATLKYQDKILGMRKIIKN